jgi:hypothetical protein
MKPPEIVAVAFYIAIALFSLYYGVKVISTEPVKLPCEVAEISPDFDNAQREQCRKIRGHKL